MHARVQQPLMKSITKVITMKGRGINTLFIFTVNKASRVNILMLSGRMIFFTEAEIGLT